MSKRLLRFAAVFLTAAVLSSAVAGCWNPFAPDDGGDTPPVKVTYKDRTSPDNVVYNLTTAYKDKNAEEYLACLAEEFVFHLNPDDYEEPGSELPPYWGKYDEQLIHEGMFGDDSDVERISLNLTNLTKDFYAGEDPQDPADDTWTYREETDLRVTVDHDDLTYLANADQDFVFRIDPNETGPDGETLWEMIEWWDLPPSSREQISEDVDERISFGLLKSIYR